MLEYIIRKEVTLHHSFTSIYELLKTGTRNFQKTKWCRMVSNNIKPRCFATSGSPLGFSSREKDPLYYSTTYTANELNVGRFRISTLSVEDVE